MKHSNIVSVPISRLKRDSEKRINQKSSRDGVFIVIEITMAKDTFLHFVPIILRIIQMLLRSNFKTKVKCE